MNIEADSLTMHGIGRVIATSSKPTRTFWSCLLLASVTFASFFVYQLATDYMKYETDMMFTAEIQSSMVFPMVTLCNGLRLYDSYNKSTFTDGFDWYSAVNPRFCMFGQYSCHFMNFTYRERYYDKSCLEFNFNQTVKQQMPMLAFGLTIDFFINESDITISEYNFANPREKAIKVYIHSSKEFLFHFNDQLVAKPGKNTKFVIKKTNIARQTKPYKSNCTVDKNKIMNLFPGNYSVTGCLVSQMTKVSYEKCGFILHDLLPYFPKQKNVTLDNQCLMNLIRETNILTSGPTTDCPLPCFEDFALMIFE